MVYQLRSHDAIRANAPKELKPNVYSYFIGTVVSTSEAEGDKETAYQVKFNIEGLPEFTEEFPVATPLFDSVREVKRGDRIIVLNFSNDPDYYAFFYLPLRQERFTGIKNYSNKIDATDKDTVVVNFPGYEATFANGAITITMNGANIDITGNVVIHGNLTATQINTEAGVDVNTHIHQDGLGVTGTPVV